MVKWDGHTHSEFCQHGSGEKTYLMIERAIELGFQRYSITEHAPLPDGIIDDPKLRGEFTLLSTEVAEYFDHIKSLKKRFGTRIEIFAGLEIDYFEDHLDYTEDLISQYRSQLDDAIFSVHFIKGRKGYCPVDFTPDLFQKELINYYGTADEVHRVYWREIRKLVSMDVKLAHSRRLGHLALVNKYIRKYPVRREYGTVDYFRELFRAIKRYGWCIDIDTAGFAQEYLRDFYFTKPMFYWCEKHGIELVYGSDAHGTNAVGQYYDRFEKIR